ncbi:MAG TPA: alpha/beta fold hydrolase [Gemmatimonadaceae bacterium]|nr:alpha/beta fold hydrolase [Gemmatimonadaceae bacterium]
MRLHNYFVVFVVAVHALPAQATPLEPCTVRGLSGDVRCGTVRVPEDRAEPNGRQLDLRVVVARATSAERMPDPLVLLAGGPGQAGTEMGDFAAQAFSLVREKRDIVLVDARGTGASHSLRCALMRTPADLGGATMYPTASVRLCRDSLSRIAKLERYTTTNIADDLEDVRRALGYRQLNLYGTSYGTRLALAFIRRHPSSVRAAVLKAVAPPTLVAPMNYAADAERAFGLLERDCRADSACARAYPSLRADLDTVLSRAARGEVRTVDSIVVARDAIAGSLMTLMQSSSQRSLIPRFLRQAAGGDARPLAMAVVQTRRLVDAAISSGMHLSVACSDDGGRIDVSAASRRDDGRTFLGSSRVRMLADACHEWAMPAAERVAGTAVHATVPVLLVSGELDPNTPPRHAEAALRTLPNGRHVILAGVAHGWTNVQRCGAAFVAEFIARASAKALDLACARVSSAPPFAMP